MIIISVKCESLPQQVQATGIKAKWIKSPCNILKCNVIERAIQHLQGLRDATESTRNWNEKCENERASEEKMHVSEFAWT